MALLFLLSAVPSFTSLPLPIIRDDQLFCLPDATHPSIRAKAKGLIPSFLLTARGVGSMAVVGGRPANQPRKQTAATLLVSRGPLTHRAAVASELAVRR